ncbi:hypothetical protein AALC17_08995 [Oscillospiraceae bacterium 38-13]
MKRMISLLLAFAIMISITTTSFAVNAGEEYYAVQVEYSDMIGHQEKLDIMIQNNNVYVDAKMLSERLGYTFGENSEGAVIYNKDTSNGLPFGITQFKYNSTQVSHMLFNNMIDTYKAPFASVKNSEGSWIPLEYSLLLINSGMMITDDALLIDIPKKRIIDYFYEIAKNSEKYNFDWADDFGYTETDIKVLGGSSHLVNVFNGLLGFDGDSWAILFQQFAGSMAAYDKRYGENLAMLLCTESDKELQATIDKVSMLIDVLDEDGQLGQMLSSTSAMRDSQVGTLYKNCEDILQKVKSGNSPLVSYNRSYQALESALDKQTWFSSTGGNILEVQKGVSSAAGKALTFLDVSTKVLEVVGYTQEFQNQDEFSLAALTYYLGRESGGLELPEITKRSMIDYSDALSSSIGEYTTKRFVENVDQWIIDEIPMHEVLGTQATAVLFAWNIASNTIPFIANGLSSADSFELALYSLVFQGDAFLNYLNKRNSIFADAGNITAENMYDISQYCYIYLKSCYITREAALASLANKTSSTKEKIQPLIDYQNSINAEIAKIMVELKDTNKTNEGCVFGFLPSDNKDYIDKYDGGQLISWIRTIDLVVDAYSEEFGGRKFNIPKITLSGDAVANINAEIWRNLYDGVVVEILEWWNQGHYEGDEYITYNWYVNDNILSLVVESHPVDWAWTDYYVYNISVPDGAVLSTQNVLSYCGLTDSLYKETAKQALYAFHFSCYGESIYERNDVAGMKYADEALAKTISAENIAKALPFINDKGELCMVCPVYSIAGADYYYNVINLNTFTLPTHYPNGFHRLASPSEVATHYDSYAESYKSTLRQYPEYEEKPWGKEYTEYTLYDVDKNGIPELIIKQTDIQNYVFYTYDGTESVLCGELWDSCFGTYAEIYKYEGNGIVVHGGGMGSDRIEYIYVQQLVDNSLTEGELKASTEDISFDELYNMLGGYTAIDNFYRSTDLSVLGG